MGRIKVTAAPIEGLYVIKPTVHRNSRGYFVEMYNSNDMYGVKVAIVFVQVNQSMNAKGVLRGLHFQKRYPQDKLVRDARGTVFKVAVDLCFGSRTYGQWVGIELNEENNKQFYIFKGFVHEFLMLSDEAKFCYKVTTSTILAMKVVWPRMILKLESSRRSWKAITRAPPIQKDTQ